MVLISADVPHIQESSSNNSGGALMVKYQCQWGKNPMSKSYLKF